MKVVIDTNAFAMIEQFKIDLIEEIKKHVPNAEPVTIKQVINELKNIRDKKAASYALALIEKENIRIKDTGEGKADELIIKYAEENKAAVATNDKELKKRCVKKGIPIIYMRQGKKIETRGI